jgi:hypothetical protein
MGGFFYYLATFAESLGSVVGIRGPYEQPRYEVVGRIGANVEIGRLFRYITGANQAGAKIAMTVPVQQSGQRIGQRIAMTIPVEMGGPNVMRFFLPESVARAGPPTPADPLVHIIKLPPETFAVLRFSGIVTDTARRSHEAALIEAVSGAGRTPEGTPSLFSYDPPFALPFVRRNEVAVKLKAAQTP